MSHELWLLRWRYEYHNRPTKYGQWNRHGDRPEDQAWAQTKEGLAYACIEGKNFKTRELKIFARCAADNFINFQWIAAVSTPLRIHGSVKRPGRILGLMLVSRDEYLSVFNHGGMETKVNETDYNKVHLAGFGR